MLSYEKTLRNLVVVSGIDNTKLQEASYQELEQAFLDRWTTMLVAHLPEKDQKKIADNIQSGANPAQVYEFLDASFDDIQAVSQKILDEFVEEYKELMGIS